LSERERYTLPKRLERWPTFSAAAWQRLSTVGMRYRRICLSLPSVGLLGTRPSYELMENCDTLFMVGSGFPYSEWLPEPGQARGVQIDIDGKMLGIRYPMEINIIGDSKQTLRALIPYLRRKADRSWREQIEGQVSRWWEILENQGMQDADPLNPMRVFNEL
jgi:pyruvate dehydrogenase (quinone)